MKTPLGLLSLVIVLVYGHDLDPQACGKTLRLDELQQMGGPWVMVALTFDKVKSAGRQIPLMSSSHLEVSFQPDNQSATVQEHNTVAGRCFAVDFNVTVQQGSDTAVRLDMLVTVAFVDGIMRPVYDRAMIEVFHNSENSKTLLIKAENQEYLLATYRAEGHDQEDLQKDLEKHRALAKCLGLSAEESQEWRYDGSAGFCHRKSEPGLELHQVLGNWVMVALTFDAVKSEGRHLSNMNSSRLEIRVSSDNRSLIVHEHDMGGDHCGFFPFNLTLPPTGQTIRRLDMHRTEWYLDGQMYRIDERATLELLYSSENKMKLLYKGINYEYLLISYQREGHLEVDVQKDVGEHRAKAKQLGLSGGDFKNWVYNGSAAFCNTVPAPEKVES